MSDSQLIQELAGILRSAAPLVLAAVGETFTERVGVVNLSLDGSLMLSALAAFVVGTGTNSLILGVLAGMLVGAGVALLVATSTLQLKLSQVAVGFVLTLFCRDLAVFLGRPFVGKPGLPPPYFNIPFLSEIPILGTLFFRQDWFTYLSFIIVIAAWFWIFRTRAGLALRAVGERPETAFARGIAVRRTQYLYCILGGALVGLAGAAFTLNVTSKWSESDISGYGWIALAIVIFGGWTPFRVAFGAYLVRGLSVLATNLQGGAVTLPPAILNMLPWALMLATLALVSSGLLERLPKQFKPFTEPLLRSRPPGALGRAFEQDS
jgi:simple sugar transport system permease protein